MAATTRQISLETIREAAAGVYEAAVRTPLVQLATEPGRPEIFLKLETLQPIGSFKIRGAYNAVRPLNLVKAMYRHRLELVSKFNSAGEVVRTVGNPRVAAAKLKAEKPRSLFFFKREDEASGGPTARFPPERGKRRQTIHAG